MVGILFGLLLLAPTLVQAQQTIFNVPTTDVLDRGKVYFELDVSLKPSDDEAVKKFFSFVPRVVVGTTRLTLEAAGYEVGEAGTGMEAFAILGGEDAWDVVLLDQKMPGMVGTEVLKRIKVLAPN